MERDRFGGFAAVKSTGTGFFRVEQIDGRWRLITPEGRGFVAVGFNHADMKYLRAGYNLDYWRERIPDQAALDEMVLADAKNWNMTMVGYGSVRPKGRFPYVLRIHFPGVSNWMPDAEFPDMFSEPFSLECQAACERTGASYAADPFLIGYCMNDCPEWPIFDRCSKRRATNWVDAIESMGMDSPGKQAYTRLMRERHGGIESFNAVYGTQFRSFDELAADGEFIYNVARNADRARADNEAFLALAADRYYDAACKAIRRVDSNHLILGEILDGNRGIPEQVLRAARGRVDVLSTQFYGFFKDQAAALARWHEASGLPILLADSCFSVTTEQMPEAVGPRLRSHAGRAEAFERYARQALRVPYIIGWIWCGYIDSSTEVERRNQHQGLKDAWGRPHEPLSTRIRETYANLYEIARAGVLS